MRRHKKYKRHHKQFHSSKPDMIKTDEVLDSGKKMAKPKMESEKPKGFFAKIFGSKEERMEKAAKRLENREAKDALAEREHKLKLNKLKREEETLRERQRLSKLKPKEGSMPSLLGGSMPMQRSEPRSLMIGSHSDKPKPKRMVVGFKGS